MFFFLAAVQLDNLTERAQLTPAEINILILALLLALILLDITLRFAFEVCIWTAASIWRLPQFRRLAARSLAAFERRVLKRELEWEIDMTYPDPHRPVGYVVREIPIYSGTVAHTRAESHPNEQSSIIESRQGEEHEHHRGASPF